MAAILSLRISGGEPDCAANRPAHARSAEYASAGRGSGEHCSGEHCPGKNWSGSLAGRETDSEAVFSSSPFVAFVVLAFRSVLMRSFSPPFRRVAAQKCSPGRKPGYKVQDIFKPHPAPPAARRAISGPRQPSPTSARRVRNRITAMEWICETRDSPTPRMIPTSFIVSSS
jgi:hypothetical protein